jgi:hypothetical protein
MFGASSRSLNRPNPDGSTNIYCSMCRDYIGVSQQRITRALCAICQASMDGKPMTEQALQDYRLSKGLKSEVSALNIPEPPITANLKKKVFSFGSVAGEVFAALGRFGAAEKTTTQKQTNTSLASVKISQEKRRPRLFSNRSIADEEPKQSLGTMAQVDKLTKDQK